MGIALSGGLDSVCLFHILHQTQAYPLFLFHVNYGLRGKESDLDQEWVMQLGQAESVPCYVLNAHDLISKGPGVQDKARKIRYQWFRDMIQKHNLLGMCTAHHINDTAETLIHNLVRKTGIKGMTGIQNRPPFYRPLLHVTKLQLQNYAKHHQLTYREDASNASCDYTRNQIRHRILPALNQLNPNASVHIARSAQQIHQDLTFFEQLVMLWKQKSIKSNQRGIFHLDFQDLTSFQDPFVALYYALHSWGFSRIQCIEMAQSISASRAGSVWKSPQATVASTSHSFCIVPNHLLQEPYSYPVVWQPSVHVENPFFDMHCLWVDPNNASFQKPQNHNAVWVHSDLLQGKWEVRNWRRGDKIQTQVGTQKISDLLGAKRIPVVLRNVWPVVLLNDRIVWVPGLARDNKVLSQETPPALIIQVKELYSPNL